MNTLEKISAFMPELEVRTEAVRLLIEAKAEIERLEKDNSALRSVLIHITDNRSELPLEERVVAGLRIARGLLL